MRSRVPFFAPFLAPLLVALVVFVFAAGVAVARPAERVLPGQKLFAELGPNDDVTVLLDVVAGTPIGLKASSYKGTTLRLDVTVADPDGAAIDLGALKKTNTKQSLVTVKSWKPARTGSYRITVTALNSTRGGFDLAITGAAPKTVAGTGTVASPGDVVALPFDALAGDVVKCAVKPAKKSALKPRIVAFADAGGAEQTIDAPKQTTPSAVATMGTSRFTVTGDASSVGAFTWTLTFVRAKAPKTKRDAAELDAVGTVTGTVVVDGQPTRTSAPGARPRTAKAKPSRRAPDVRAGELVVSMPSARSWAEVAAAADAAMPGARSTVTASISETGPYLLHVEHLAQSGSGSRAKSVTRALAASASDVARTAAPAVEWFSTNGIVHGCADPTDPMYAQQSYLRALGLQQAWQKTTGDGNVVVAVLDTGRVFHPDLFQQWVGGYDFVSGTTSSSDGDGWDPDPSDAAYDLHGTHVAGIIGARTNNGVGVSGVLWQTRLLAVRVLGKDGGTFFDVAAGLNWATGVAITGLPVNPNPARVVNMSLGAPYDDPVMRTAVAGAIARNVVIVAAAGNEGSSERFYPAAYPNVIPVYALDANLYWASYSNWGDWISVGAPGGDQPMGQPGILNTYYDVTTAKPSYEELSGTSMAAPQVAGIAALMVALKPSLTPAEVRDILQKTASDLGEPGFDTDFGWGLVNAAAAIEYVLTPYAPPNAIDVTPTALSFTGVSNQSVVSVRTKSATPVTIQTIDVTTTPLTGWITVTADRMTTPATLTVQIDPALGAGSYTGRIRLTTSVGIVDVSVRVIRAPQPKLNIVRISAVTPEGRVAGMTTTSAAKQWAYTLTGLPLGRYQIRTFADQNANLQLDRVDEWDGVWPLVSQPQYLTVSADALDAETINVPLERYDTKFSFSGTGAGHVDSALALRAADSRTNAPISGANVHLGGGQPQTLTDARGRGVLVGGFVGGQVVTVVAAGYHPMTRAGFDAQYQGFALESLTPPATQTVTATILGLGPQDRDVWLQVGDGKGHAVYDGVNAPAITVTYTQSAEPVPISAYVHSTTGAATRRAYYDAPGPDAPFDVTVTALPPSVAQARSVYPIAPPSNFTASGATLGATTYLRWNDSAWVPIGDSVVGFSKFNDCWYGDPGLLSPALPMKIEVNATDTPGRSLRQVYYGTTTRLQTSPSEAFTFATPPAISAPANGATNVAAGPTMTWSFVAGAQLHRVVIEKVGADWHWTIWVAGTLNQFQLPSIPSGGLEPATNYRWRVESFRFATTSFNENGFRDTRLDLDVTSRVVTAWATFRTQ